MSQAGQFIVGGAIPVAEKFTTDSGVAIPDGSGNVNVFGDGIDIHTSGSGSTITISGTNTFNYTAVSTTPYVVLVTDYFLGVATNALAITIELPNAPATGRTFVIKDVSGNALANNITVTTVGGVVLIDAAATYVIATNYESINVLFNGTKYLVF